MSKYNALWEYVKNSGAQSLKLTFDEIQNIAGVPIDHSFLKYKKELTEYGYQVGKISMKEQTITFEKYKDTGWPKTRKKKAEEYKDEQEAV